MASDLSSVCTEGNEIIDDEKEEGELSLEDVSSSEDVPPYRFPPRRFGQCPHCLSMGHCATWCRSLTLNKKIFVRACISSLIHNVPKSLMQQQYAGCTNNKTASQRKPLIKVQPYERAEVAYVITEDAGKENRRHHHHHHRHVHHQRATAPAPIGALFSEDLQPISSDDDLELVGLAKKKKTRKKKRRKKSPSLSLSPCPVDMAIKESIHHRGPTRRHQSPVRRKPQQHQQPQQQLHKSPPPIRKPSPQRMKKLKRPVDGDSPLQSRGTVTKLLKKVKKLEPFSTRSKEKRSSLKDKLSNIIGGKKNDEEEMVVVQLNSKDKSPEVETREVTKTLEVRTTVEEQQQRKEEVPVEQQNKQEVIAEEKKNEVTSEVEKRGDDEVSRKITLTLKSETSTSESSESVKPTPTPTKIEEPDEDLQLRVIALRSAVLKKHRTRLARANKLQQQQQAASGSDPVPRIESPFTSSFNEDFPLLAEICSPGSPLDSKKNDIYCPEDMELDSDMELDKEISMVLSGAEEESNKIADGDSPYSPTDDLGSPQRSTDQPMDLSMYTPSHPTKTPMALANNKKNRSLDGSIFESRPYSPSDVTVYDPELPGVLGTSTSVPPPPLQPPPLPPLGMMPIMPMNLLGTFPIMPMAGFAPVNPMLTAPFIPFTSTTSTAGTTAPVNNNIAPQLMEEFETDLDGSPLVPIEPKDTNWKFIGEPLYLPELNKLPIAGLVPAPVLKCNKQLQKTPPMKKPSESLFRNAEMRPVAIEEENKNGGATFKPIKLPTPSKKSVTTQPAAAFGASVEETADSQKQIWPELEQDLRELEELEEQENKRRQEMEEKKKQEQREAEERKKQEQREAEELEKRRKQEQREAEEKRRHEKEESERRKKREREEANRRRRLTPIRRLRQKSVTPAPRARRRSARTPSRARDLYKNKSSRSSRDSETRSKSKKTENGKEKPDEKMEKLSIDDDEQALREILLASLAKRRPNAKRKAALEAAKRKAILEAAMATSDKENIAEKPAEVTPAVAPENHKFEETNPATLDGPQSISPSSIETVVPSPSVNVSSVLMPTVLQQTTLKRPALPDLPCEQPPRKVVKKLNVIPASTRAVNNAIRYQNLLIQRKLISQQKLALYKTRFAVNNGEQRAESPPLVVQSPSESPRFVISLNEDTESDSEADDKKKESPTNSRPLLVIPTTDFEKSVDQFLKGVRLQQERTATPTTMATIIKPVTPPIVPKVTSSAASKIVATVIVPAVTDAADAAATTNTSTTTTTTTTATTAATATTTTTADAIAKVVAATSTTLAKDAVTTTITIAVPKVATTTVAASAPKERTVLNIPKPTMTTSCLSITTTPQAVKHLPASQQEEYRRLKRQIYEYEQLRLQKAKESAVAGAATTSQAQPTTVKPLNTSSSLITPSSSPTLPITTSTPKVPTTKLIPKMQLIAAISPMSKPSIVTAPVVVTPTKIIHCTSNVMTKTVAPTINPASKLTSSSITVPSNSKPVVTSVAKPATLPDPNQLKLLSKITESLNSQNTLLNSAANKISSLRVLTKEQINRKTSRIQQKNSCVVMDDLNKTGENKVVAEKKSNDQEMVEGENSSKEKGLGNKIVEKAPVSVKEEFLPAEKTKDEDKLKQTWEDFRQVVNDEVQTLSNLSSEYQKKLLSETEEKLISKRHAVLDDITEMSGSLRQWEIERDLQNIITAEIVSLREQLRIAEEKLQGQKIKLQTIQPKVTLYHEKINTGRKECFRLSKICNGLGQQIVGSGYKVPTAGAELLNNRIKEVATHTQKLRSKKTLSVQSNNSVKTGKLLKNNHKANGNPNLRVKEANKKQKYIAVTQNNKADSMKKISYVSKAKMSENCAGVIVPNVAKAPDNKNIFNKKNSNQTVNVNKGKLSVTKSSIVKIEESNEKSQSTNLNFEKNQDSKGVQLVKSETVSDQQSHLASMVTVDSVAPSNTSNMEIDNQCDPNTTNIISDTGADETNTIGTNNVAVTSNVENTEGSNPTVSNNTEESNMEIVQEAENISRREISNNGAETFDEKANNESNQIINNNAETLSEIDSKSIKDQSVSAPSQIIKNNSEVSEVVPLENTTASSNNEKLSAVPIGQSADVPENLEEISEKVTDTTVQSNIPGESENIANEMCTSNSILNNSADKMETENIIDETRMDEQSTNLGATIVITDTDNVESDSVNNNNTSSVVNTSLDDYMKEMSVNDEYDSMCSKDYKSSASVTSNEHSTTFEEEIRLLELASETEPPHNCQSIAKKDNEQHVDNCQPIVEAERESIVDRQSEAREQGGIGDDCEPVGNVEHDPTGSEPTAVKNYESSSSVEKNPEQDVTDDPSSQILPKKVSKKAFRPYESILKLVRAPRNEKTDGILCPFALMGTCIDDECRYIHQPTSHCQ